MTAPSLAAAIREAEEWLTRYDGAVPAIPPGSADPPEVRLLRSLLAAGPGAKTPRISRDDGHYELGLRMAITDAREYDLAWATWAQKLLDDANRVPELESLLRECNAVCLCGCPDSEHEADECGDKLRPVAAPVNHAQPDDFLPDCRAV